MKLVRLLSILVLVPFLFGVMACDDDDDKKKINEAEVLIQYLESTGGDYINTQSCPSMRTAEAVFTGIGGNHYLIDIRAAADFTAGHIEGAVNVPLSDVLDFVEAMDPAWDTYETIVIVCYSGQSASYVSGLMRLLGFNNVYAMKWGMSSWADVFAANVWNANISNAYVGDFVTTDFTKAAAGDLPEINTGFEIGAEILRARVEAIFAAGFGEAKATAADVNGTPDNYYIVNYWKQEHYDVGHIDGAIQYTPRADLHTGTFLQTLPVDQPVVIYCYTGQTSAHIAAFLRVMGYDGRTLVWGCNGMIYDTMVANSMTVFSDTQIMNYPYVTGN